MPPRSVLCPKCGSVVATTAVRCPKCGTDLAASDNGTLIPAKAGRKPLIGSHEALSQTLDGGDESMGRTMDMDHAGHLDATMTDEGKTVDGTHDFTPEQKKMLGIGPAVPKPAPAARASRVGPKPSENPPPRSSGARRGVVIGGAAATAAAVSVANDMVEDAPVTRSRDLIGEKLGEYVVEERVGVGGMGIVYRARQPLIGTNVAIKVLRPDVLSDKRDVERFLEEARVVNGIKHRGIINIFGAGAVDDGRQYLIMEFLDGETLEKKLERDGKLTLSDATPILEQVLAALTAAHGAGIVHRDLKPANVFLVNQSDGPPWVKLLDFGLARRSQQEVSRIAGTPDYISPEHAKGRPAGPPADLYAFGILCFHLLTGKLPFVGKTPMEVMEKHVHEPAPVPASIEPSISAQMSGFILSLLEKDPAKRPDSAQAKSDLKAATRVPVARASGVVPQLPNEKPRTTGSRPRATRTGAEAQTQPSDAQKPSTVEVAAEAAESASAAELAPRMKELARKADRERLVRALVKNWPWVLGVLALLWVVGVAIYILVSPTAPPPQDQPLFKKKPAVVVPPKVEAPAPVAPPAPVPEAAAPAPGEAAPAPVEAAPGTEAAAPAEAAPVAAPVAAPSRPRADPLESWKRKTLAELEVMDGHIFEKTEQFRPAIINLKRVVSNASSQAEQFEADESLRSLKNRIEAAQQ